MVVTRLVGIIAGAALALAGCGPRDDRELRVGVIGASARLTDPAGGPLTVADAVLLGSVAQGLVRFDATGQIEPGLAERWNVSDDGLSYIFRLASAEWPSGRKVSAADVARLLRRQIARPSRNELKDAVGAIDEIVAMTDRVLEIRLLAPRPHLLQLLAQPEFSLLRERQGSGPFAASPERGPDGAILLRRSVPGPDGDEARRERARLIAEPAARAIERFVAGESDVLLGGTFAELPLARSQRLPRGSLRFDPVAGLFGLVPARSGGPLAQPDLRRLLDQAIDRPALVAALAVPDLEPRATLLQPGLAGLADPVAPPWSATPLEARLAALRIEANRLFGDDERPVIRVALPDGPGARILLDRLRADWGALGLGVEPAEKGIATDLRLIDAVAPSDSPAWFLRHFRCGRAPICSTEADDLLDAARAAPVAAQRNALIAEAERAMSEAILFLALAAPVRWSLVSRDAPGFAENIFARHPLTDLGLRSPRFGGR